jgi:hypothetical protein
MGQGIKRGQGTTREGGSGCPCGVSMSFDHFQNSTAGPFNREKTEPHTQVQGQVHPLQFQTSTKLQVLPWTLSPGKGP